MVTENKLFDVTVHFQVEAPDLEHAIEKAADYTYRLPKDKKVEIFDSKTQESVASIEK